MAVKINYKVRKIFRFGPITDGSGDKKDLLGGKGANLAEMAKIGIPVPPGFTIPTGYSIKYQENPQVLQDIWTDVSDGMGYLYTQFGYMPLVSVRSGARVSMPGMMDTILNVGLTTANLHQWIDRVGERTTYDSYRRLIQMYGSVVLGIPSTKFEEILADEREKAGVTTDVGLSVSSIKNVVKRFKLVVSKSGAPFPDTLEDQLAGAINAVFKSWNNQRAKEYRQMYSIPEDWGTAVNVQAMVFGNAGEDSYTGVLFTRDPSTGNNLVVGEFLPNAQGEDVVAGIRTPLPLEGFASIAGEVLNAELMDTVTKLENHYRDMQDVEFTVQSGKLYILQTRSGKRAATAAFKIAKELVDEGAISIPEALSRFNKKTLLGAYTSTVAADFNVPPHLVGIAAGGGAVTGTVVFDSASAVNCTGKAILVRNETDPDDIAGIAASVGVLTATGGLTSHAAVVARGMNKVCVVGASNLVISSSAEIQNEDGTVTKFYAGDKITIDGGSGKVWVGIDVPVLSGDSNADVAVVVSWALSQGIVERLSFNGMDNPKDVESRIGKGERVYVDTTLFPQDRLTDYMDAIQKAIAHSNTLSKVYVDVDTRQLDTYTLDAMFGQTSDASATQSKLLAIESWGSEILSKIVVVGHYNASPNSLNLIRDRGGEVVGDVTSLPELLDSRGAINVSPEVINSVFGGEKYFQQIVDMVVSTTGKELYRMQAPTYWFDVFGES